MFVFDRAGNALTWNAGVHEILGYSREEFVGQSVYRIFTDEDLKQGAHERELAEAEAHGTVADSRWHVRSDGTRFWAEVSLHAISEDARGITGFLKIMQDCTSAKKLQDRLKAAHRKLELRVEKRTRELSKVTGLLAKTELRFKEAFRAAPLPILLVSGDDVVVDVNTAFEQLSGYSRDEIMGQGTQALGLWVSEEGQSRLRKAQVLQEGFRELKLQLRTRDGKIRDVLCSAAIAGINDEGWLVKMFLDVTERKHSEQQLLKALQEVMQDTSWLAQQVIEKLAEAQGGREASLSLADFTTREREVLDLLAQGKSNDQIGQDLQLAASTVRNYVANIYGKIGVHSRAEAVVWARERGVGGL